MNHMSADWIWMPHPAHFICARDCRFHLATFLPQSQILVSTIGEYLPDAPVREILASTRGINLNGRGDARLLDYLQKVGYEEVGYQRKYETLAFEGKRRTGEMTCCPFTAASWTEIDMTGYNDPKQATNGHLLMCEKWHNASP